MALFIGTHIIILITMLRSMHNNNTLFGLLALLALHTNPIVCLGAATDLCDANPDICELVTGCYPDKTSRDGSCNMNWWAYVPTGEYKCPTEGCPLYIWMHGTMEANVREPESYVMQLEMLKRGYIAVQAGYDDDMFGYVNSPGKLLLTLMLYKAHLYEDVSEHILFAHAYVCILYTSGCEGGYFYQGILDKARAIFDGNDENSVVSQMCDGPDALANCDLGVAVHGYSQGAQLGSLAGNFDKRISAALLFGNGNYQTFLRGDYSCLNNENIALPRERRRSITGSNDGVFGDGTVAGAMKQQKETSGYDCGDSLDCFSHVPNEVPDTYLGGDAMIEGKMCDDGLYTSFRRALCSEN